MAVSKAISVTEPIGVPRSRTKLEEVVAWMLVSILLGVAAGALVFSLVQAGNEAARVAQIQSSRAEATVRAYEQAWASLQPTDAHVRVTGTGPALAWVAEQQANWAENAVTGTGPGLITLAKMQAGYGASSEPTGTGPGLTHLREPDGPEVAVVGTP
ncbi:MAG TPA: hypothetical protein VFT27_12175 [Actinomycetota bacterium]|nr:hypothetical protein [Actinomycetota bacterium]